MVMLNDNYHGESKEYYIDGKIKIESNYAYDALEGVKTTYFPNGTIKSTETFLQGFLHGPSKFYDQNGKLTNHFEYNYNDMLDQVK
jgi:antitoxin component YwqK of YwqJK toxin-antitoxin module